MQYKDTRGLEWIPDEPGNRIATLMSPASKAKREREKGRAAGPCCRRLGYSNPPGCTGKKESQKNGSFSLIERVILSAGAMLIFSVSFQIDQMPEGEEKTDNAVYIASIVLWWCLSSHRSLGSCVAIKATGGAWHALAIDTEQASKETGWGMIGR
jgi:hypothetical protein